MVVWCHLAPKDAQRRIAFALRQVSENLIVSPILLDDINHVLEDRGFAGALWNRHRLFPADTLFPRAQYLRHARIRLHLAGVIL